MSDKHFTLTLVTPDRCLLDAVDVIAVNAQGELGTFNARPGHEPFLTALKGNSELWYRDPTGTIVDFYVEDGIIEVLPERVTVLASVAYNTVEMSKGEVEEIERQKTEEIKKKIEETKRLASDSGMGKIEIEELEWELKKSTRRIQFLRKNKDLRK
jgi:F0F1-type ATP synthase epsilon subunit